MAVCQISSMSLTQRPTKRGFIYSSTAVATAAQRWVKVAQPRPYSPGSLVSTFTTTRSMPRGAVKIVFTFRIVTILHKLLSF